MVSLLYSRRLTSLLGFLLLLTEKSKTRVFFAGLELKVSTKFAIRGGGR